MYATQVLVKCVAAKSRSVSPALATIHGRRVGESAEETPRKYILQMPDDICHHLVFYSTFEELKLPISWPMERAWVTKLYKPFPTPCLYVAPAACIQSAWWGEFP